MSEMTEQHVQALRRAFDESFARPVADQPAALVPVLTLTVAGKPIVLRLDDLRGVHHRRRIVPVRGAFADLLGLSGLNGEIVPVYDSAHLLGLGSASRHWQWWALSRHPEPVALAFERLESYAAVPAAQFTRGDEGAHAFIDAYLSRPHGLVPVIDVKRLVRSILDRAGASAAPHLEDPCPAE